MHPCVVFGLGEMLNSESAASNSNQPGGVSSSNRSAVGVGKRCDRVEAGNWVIDSHVEREIASKDDLARSRLFDQKLEMIVDQRIEPNAV